MANEWPGFYSPSEVARLARVPGRTLRYWQQHKIIQPSMRIDGEEGYSYADLTIIRLLRAIRERKINFQSARITLRHLYKRLGPPSSGWMEARVFFIGADVYAYQPDEWEITDATLGGQKIQPLLFSDVFASLVPEIENLGPDDSVVIPREYRESITIDPSVKGGMPVLKGTRIATALLAALRAQGRTVAQIASLYDLGRQVVSQALAYEVAIATPATAA